MDQVTEGMQVDVTEAAVKDHHLPSPETAKNGTVRRVLADGYVFVYFPKRGSSCWHQSELQPAAEPFKSNIATHDPKVLRVMQKFGGGFASALATAWMKADLENSAKLMREFLDLYTRYAEMAAHIEAQGEEV